MPATEYGLIAAIVGIGIIVGLGSLRDGLNTLFKLPSLRTFDFPVDPFHRMCLEVRADGRPKRGEKGSFAELRE